MKTYRRLLLALLLVGIVPLLLAGAIAERAVRAFATDYASLRGHADAEYVADAISNFIAVSEADFQAMGIAISARDGATENWSEVLRQLHEVHPHFPTLGLVDPTGTILASADAGSVGRVVADVPEPLRALFLKTLRGDARTVVFADLGKSYAVARELVAAGRVQADAVPATLDLSLLMPVDDAQGKRVGVLYGTLETDAIMNMLKPYDVPESPNLEAFVIDSDGRVLFNHHRDGQGPGALMNDVFRGMVDAATVHADQPMAPLLEVDDHHAYVSVKPIGRLAEREDGGWRLAIALPYELVVSGINQGFRQASLVLLMIVTAALLAALWLAQSFARPIHALTRTAERMADGDYSTRAESSTSVEINQLAEAFNRMADAVAAEKQRLEAEIAERKLTQARVDELQQRQELILDNAGDGLLGVDAEGLVTFVNPAAARLLDLEGEDLTGRRACTFWCPGSEAGPVDCAACALTPRCMQADAGRPLQHVLTRTVGEQLDIEYVVSPMLGDRGLQGAVITFRDVRHRKAYEEQMKKARLAAEAASRAKSQFLANMSHEIRTPMNGVLGFTSLLRETSLSDEQKEHVDIIHGSAESLLHVINDILDFSKVEAGKLTVERLPFDLTEAVEDVVELFSPQADSQGLEMAVSIAADVPACLEADPGRVRQVLINLVGNALKFTREGHVLVEVESVSDADGRCVRCTVSDTGIGVPLNKQAELFEPFTQADASTTREFGGTGLGLIISKRLVELMGGTIGFDSESGGGSRFWFTLPQAADAQPPVCHPPTGLGRLRVLVVDDHDVNRRLVSEQLGRWGVAHACVESARQALARLREAHAAGQEFDIAVLDYLMPCMDGLELGRRIKADASISGTRLIMLTSGSQRSEAGTFMAAGFSAFLMKPLVNARELLEVITRVAGPEVSEPVTPTVAPPDPDQAGARLRQAALQVLVAEDNAVNQRLIRHMLEKLGCRVAIAANGHDAVQLACEVHYDLVFMDCLMPAMDGYDATAELRRRGIETPIVALTANAMAQHREQCMAVGMDDYLSKPVRLEDVAGMLLRWGLKPAAGRNAAAL